MPAFLNGLFRALSGFIGAGVLGVAGVLAGGSVGAALITLYFVLRDRINTFRKAKDYAERGHLRRAFALLAVELRRNPSNRPALLLRADMERDRGLYAEAEGDYYSLIDLKKPGDGIEVLEVKKRLIPVLYGQGKLYETLKLIREVLTVEKSSAEALYHLGLIYLGQLYYREAWKVFERVIGSRPRMAQALFAASVACVQLKEYGTAIDLIRKAREIDEEPLYTLVGAGAHFLMGNHREAGRMLASLPEGEKAFDSPMHAHFYHRLSAFTGLKSNAPDSAAEHLSEILQALKREGKEKIKRHGPGQGRRPSPSGLSASRQTTPGVYNRFGRLERGEKDPREKTSQGRESVPLKAEAVPGRIARDFFRLKEVTRDAGLWTGAGRQDVGGQEGGSSAAFLDLEGLSRPTWAILDLGFSMVRAGRLAHAREIFESLSRSNPEVMGVRRILELIREKEGEAAGDKPAPGKNIRETTNRVVAKKKRRYELWEYVERWEEDGIRPYHLMMACGLVARKQLNHQLLFPNKGLFGLDI